MLLVTSYERLRRYLSDERDTPITDSQYLKRELTDWMSSVTRSFEKYLNRSFLTKAYTEYFDATPQKQRYYPRGTPISSITSAYYDMRGLYSGTSESQIDDDTGYIIGAESNSVYITNGFGFSNPKGLRLVYTGGFAYHGTRSTFVITTGNAFTTNYFVLGNTSGAMGIVISRDTKTLVLDNLRGAFEAGETITEYTTESADAATTVTDVIASITYQSLAEAYPDITIAAQMQIRYMFKHKDDFELVGSTRDATNLRRNNERPELRFIAEVVNMLAPYRRMHGR